MKFEWQGVPSLDHFAEMGPKIPIICEAPWALILWILVITYDFQNLISLVNKGPAIRADMDRAICANGDYARSEFSSGRAPTETTNFGEELEPTVQLPVVG